MKVQILWLCLFQTTLSVQEKSEHEEANPLSKNEFRLDRWREKVAAHLGDRDIRIGEILDYLEAQYAPGLRQELDSAYGQVQMESGDFDAWVQDYADIQLLRPLATQKEILVHREEITAEAKRLAEAEKKRYLAEGKLDAAAAEAVLPSLVARTLRNQGIGIEKQLLLERLFPSTIDPKELRAHFVSHALRFGGSVKLSHILLSVRDPVTRKRYPRDTVDSILKNAESLIKQIREGSGFAELAKIHSDDLSTNGKGGDLGYVRRQAALPEAVTRAAFDATPGDILGPVESEWGFHILRVMDRKSFRHPEFSEVRAEVEQDYRREKTALLLERLRKEAGLLLY